MILNRDELWNLVKSSEWLITDDTDDESKEYNRKVLKLHNKLKKFHEKNKEQFFTLRKYV